MPPDQGHGSPFGSGPVLTRYHAPRQGAESLAGRPAEHRAGFSPRGRLAGALRMQLRPRATALEPKHGNLVISVGGRATRATDGVLHRDRIPLRSVSPCHSSGGCGIRTRASVNPTRFPSCLRRYSVGFSPFEMHAVAGSVSSANREERGQLRRELRRRQRLGNGL
jgi:hypothetical protein